MTKRKLNYEEFQTWRALFAFAFTDGELSLEEKNVLSDHLKNVELTESQKEKLVEDMQGHVSVEKLFYQIGDDSLKKLFCEVSRTLAWCEGDIDRQEEEILKRVACLDKPEYSKFLKESANSPTSERYLRQYQETGRIGAQEPLPMFEAWA